VKKKITDKNLGPTRVVAYIRVSTGRQADTGSSLEAQESALRAFAKFRGLELVRIEVDAGLSASSLERPGLQRALSALDSFEAQGILVVKLDRLTRSVRDFCDLCDTYFKDGQNILLSVHESVDTSNAMGRMVLNILMSVSQWEREAASERTQAVKAHLKTSGAYAGGWPPYGYELDEDGNLIENAEEAAILIQARAFRQGGMSIRSVAAALPANPRTGKPFNATQIVRMM
jgi:DNA invertase Pin-like site-specific DNA recombinase